MPSKIGFWAVSRKDIKDKLQRHAFTQNKPPHFISENTIDSLQLEVGDALDEKLDETIAFHIVKNRL